MSLIEIIEKFCSIATIIDIIVFAIGLLLLFIWLVRTTFGTKALGASPPRRNNMPPYLPLVPLFIWVGCISAAASIINRIFGDLSDWQSAFWNNAILCGGSIVTGGLIIFLARRHFARRLKGFGLDIDTIHKDFFAAFVNLISILPIVMLMVLLTIVVGKFLWGEEFQMAPHEELELLRAYPQTSLKLLIIVTAVFIIPAFEEMLFRGLFQTMIRSYVLRPWPSIAISAVLFSVVHGNASHWPALFILSLCLGYSYEKSGSLFRPIFIHSFFNAISIAAALYSV